MPNFEDLETAWKIIFPPELMGNGGYPIIRQEREYDLEGVPESVKKYAHLFNRKEGVK